MSTGIHVRVKDLIDRRYVGKVQRAAAAWGVAQPTLRRIYKGLNVRPSAEVLHRIAKATGTTTEWLLTGEGVEPREYGGAPVASADEWRSLIREIEQRFGNDDPFRNEDRRATLSNEREVSALCRGLEELGSAPWGMALSLGLILPKKAAGGVTFPAGVDDPQRSELWQATLAATDAISRAWLVFLRRAIDVLGVDDVWRRLRKANVGASMGFGFVATFLAAERKSDWPVLLSDAEEWNQAMEASLEQAREAMKTPPTTANAAAPKRPRKPRTATKQRRVRK